MVDSSLVEPEFVVHLFAPLDGPNRAAALAGAHALWKNCRTQLGMTHPIVETGLPPDLPDNPGADSEGALAALQDPAVQFQAIARREHDVLNISFAIAAPSAVPRFRLRLASALPPDWHDLDRWWHQLDGTMALLGGAVVLLAKTPDPSRVDLRAAVPPWETDADGWWTAGYPLRGFAAWETTVAGAHESRRLVLLADPGQDAELSRFAWSDGHTTLPPLARYLMHAAKLRYQARVRGDGSALTRLRQRTSHRIDELNDQLRKPDNHRPTAEIAALAGDEADLLAALENLRLMRRSVEVARDNMARILDEPLPADANLAAWLAVQLTDDTEYLEATRERAEGFRAILDASRRTNLADPQDPTTPRKPPDPSKPEVPQRSTRTQSSPAQAENRVAFAVDVVNYSSRSTPQQREVQARLAGMTERVLNDLGVSLHETDRQPGGDGMMVVLPPRVPAHLALPKLLNGWRVQVVSDNAAHPESRIQLRLSVGSGPFTLAAVGFTGQTIIAIGRLLDSDPIRQAIIEHPDADLAAIVTDRIYQDVVGEQYPGLHGDEFIVVEVIVKKYHAQAWLWTRNEPPRPPAKTRQARASTSSPGDRDVFVIHGPGRQPRADMFALVQALDLRPLSWEDIVTRTGKAAPYVEEILAVALRTGPGVLAIMTPDDLALGHSDVLMRVGRALSLRPDHTILVEIGQISPIADLSGRDMVRLVEDTDYKRTVFQYQIAERLRIVGYPVNTSGPDWLDPQRFAGQL